MARRRGGDLGQAFRDDSQLQQFLLSDVTLTGKTLGTGSYGSVVEVSYNDLVCAGKRIHGTLIEVQNEGVDVVVYKYLQECQLMSSLSHPNITQFLGICFIPENQLPLLVMERLETSLDKFLENTPDFHISLKISMLEDVACGLLYLHDQQPPVIHRDLTSRNVLLTASLVAKITDMGNSCIVTVRTSQPLTKCPGTAVYMPPEAHEGHYGPSLDIFSFGHLALYTLTQTFPGSLLCATYLDGQEIRGRSEVQRRGEYMEQLEHKIQSDHPDLVMLVKQCLHNDPRVRPSTEQLLTTLQEVREQVEGVHEGDKLDEMVENRSSTPLKLTWIRGPDMPMTMSGVQSVVMQDKVYMGGGYSGKCRKDLVMEYDISSERWTTLPPYTFYNFAMAMVSNQLVLIGGRHDCVSDKLGVWGADDKKWTYPYPVMPTARWDCSVVVWNEWLVVAGGYGGKGRVSCVEVLNTSSKKWYIGPSTPAPWSRVKAAVVEGVAYFMGGINYSRSVKKVYSVGLDTLISHITSQATSDGDRKIWKEIPDLQLTFSTPLSISGSLLAVGGEDKDDEAVTAIHLYQPDSGTWMKVGDLPSPRCLCACAVTTDRRVLVAGGWEGGSFGSSLKRVDFVQILR